MELQCANRQKVVLGFMVRKAVALVAMAKLVAMSNPRALGRRVRDPLSPPPGGVALAENRGRVSLPRSEDDGVGPAGAAENSFSRSAPPRRISSVASWWGRL